MKRATTFAILLASLFATTVTTAAEQNTIRVAAPWEVSGPDPATDGSLFLRMGVMETLVNANTSAELEPGLATAWNVSDDGLTWRFELRETNFHDGTPLTGEAVAAALTRASENPGPLSKAPLNEIRADGMSVSISMSEPFAALPAFLAHSSNVIPALSASDGDGKPVAAIGTGPFKVDELTPPQSLTTVRNNDYWGEAANIESASYLATKRAETRALMAESGDADLVYTLDPAGFGQLGSVDSVVTESVSIPRVIMLKANADHAVLGENDARKALSLAIDREGIAAGITRFPEASATQLFPPVLSGWHDPELPALGYDPDTAKSLLAGLGWKPGDDGILVRDNERFSLTLRTFPDRPELPLIATALQDQWREIGVELEVSVSNYSEIPAGHQDGSLELALFARNYGLTPDPIGSVLQDFSENGGDWGAMNWEAPDVSAALKTIAETGEMTERNPLIKKVAKSIHDELPVIPVVWYQQTVSHAKELENVVIDPLERTYGLNKIRWSN